MTTEYLIVSDYNDLKRYFTKKFELLELSSLEENSRQINVADSDETLPKESFARISHFIKPDMTINIYAYFEFWINQLCDIKIKKSESLVDATERYLSKENKFDIVKFNKHLEDFKILGILRNADMHRGGHFKDNEIAFLKNTNLLDSINMLVVSNNKIFEWLENTKTLLLEINNICTQRAKKQ